MKPQIIAFVIFLAVCAYAVYVMNKPSSLPLPKEGFETKKDPETDSDSEEETEKKEEPESKKLTEPETRDLASAPIQTTSLTPIGQTFLNAVKASGANLSLVPTEANLERASEGEKKGSEGFEGSTDLLTRVSKGTQKNPAVLSKDDLYALYTPLQPTIKPHQKIDFILPTLTSDVSTDKGTGAEQIRTNQIYTPSIRQMIRDDVSTAVREEVEASGNGNPYEVSFSYQ